MEQAIIKKTSRVAKWKVALATVAISAVLVIPAGAQDTNDATVTVEAGDLTESIGPAAFGTVPFSTSDQDETAVTAITVTDNRGGDGNWHTTLEASDLEDDTESIPASGMTYLNGSDETGDDDGTVTHGTDVTGLEAEGGAVIAEGAGAHGQSAWNGNLELTVPGSTLAGTYGGTLTLTAVEGPETP